MTNRKMALQELIDLEEKIEREIKIARQKIKINESEKKQLTRKQRVHRLCNHGALLEQYLSPDEFTEEQIQEIMEMLFHRVETLFFLEEYRAKRKRE